MKLETVRFGLIKIEEEKLVSFDAGIPGFDKLKKFVLIPQGESGVYFWLQSVQDPAVAFLLTDPFIFFKDYDINITETDAAKLQIKDVKETLVFVIVTLAGNDAGSATVNLVAPVIINVSNKKGMQVILDGTKYKSRHLLFSRAAQSETGTGGNAVAGA